MELIYCHISYWLTQTRPSHNLYLGDMVLGLFYSTSRDGFAYTVVIYKTCNIFLAIYLCLQSNFEDSSHTMIFFPEVPGDE